MMERENRDSEVFFSSHPEVRAFIRPVVEVGKIGNKGTFEDNTCCRTEDNDLA